MTPKQLALAANRVISACLREAGEDVDAGLEASEVVLAVATDEQLVQFVAEDEQMRATLATLDAALSSTAPHREAIALALEEEQYGRPVVLYGTSAGVFPVPPASTEVGRLAEVGSPGSGALDTATERKGTRKTWRDGKPMSALERARRRARLKKLRVKRWKEQS